MAQEGWRIVRTLSFTCGRFFVSFAFLRRHNSTLQQLALDGNKIRNAGAAALGEVLRCAILHSCWLFFTLFAPLLENDLQHPRSKVCFRGSARRGFLLLERRSSRPLHYSCGRLLSPSFSTGTTPLFKNWICLETGSKMLAPLRLGRACGA